MGIPTVAPPAIDPARPLFNRPLNPAPGVTTPFPHDAFLQVGAPLTAFEMPAKPAPNQPGDTTPDPWKQVPFTVGDFVTYQGNLYKIAPNALVTPFDPTQPAGPTNRPMHQQFYVSAYALQAANVQVTTAPGTVAQAGPAYLMLFKSKVGTGGANLTVPANPALGTQGGVIPIAEPKLNVVIRGVVTDATQLVDIFAVDVDPATGNAQPRLLGTVLPQTGFPVMGNKGRFIFDVGILGNLLPDTRQYRVRTRHGQVRLPGQAGLNQAPLCGLLAGQYQAPNFEFQFADPPLGFPLAPDNFNTFPFLVNGEGPQPSPPNPTPPNPPCPPQTRVVIGPLTPFPPSGP